MKNSEVAKVFQDIADLLELKGENVFKIRAYQKERTKKLAQSGGPREPHSYTIRPRERRRR